MSNEKLGSREPVKVIEPSARDLINFLASKLPAEQQLKLGEEENLDLLGLIMKVKKQIDDPEELKTIEKTAESVGALEKLGQMFDPPLTKKEIIKEWVKNNIPSRTAN